MRSPKKLASDWLERPQVTNREALVVGLVGFLATSVVVYGARKLLAVFDVTDFGHSIPVWLAAIVAGAMLAFGLVIGARKGANVDQLHGRISDLEARAEELATYETYAEHLRDALVDLRKVLASELPDFSLRDFIEGGLFQPAQRLLRGGRQRGEIRFSILHADGDDFVMAGESGLFPALGHSLEARQRFRLPIVDSFSVHAYRRRKIFASSRVSDDGRFTPHPKATRPYESIVSLPLWSRGSVDGVLNVVATEPDSFSAVDRSYLALVAAIIDVARAAAKLVEGLLGTQAAAAATQGPSADELEPNERPAELPPGEPPD